MELTQDEKFKFSKHLSQFTKLYNDTELNPFREYSFQLSEISFGHGNYNIANNSSIFYFDYPYPNAEKGKIIDVVNDSQRGILPRGSTLNPATYKNLDIELAIAFASKTEAEQKREGYIFYKFYQDDNYTPDIIEIKTNLSSEIIQEDKLLKYFFLIFHCTELSIAYQIENIFSKRPKKIFEAHPKGNPKYLLYFNYRDHENENNQAITAAFLGEDDRLFNEIESDVNKITKIYSELFPLLVNMFNNPV